MENIKHRSTIIWLFFIGMSNLICRLKGRTYTKGVQGYGGPKNEEVTRATENCKRSFDILLTVHLNIFISILTNLMY